MNQNLFGCCNNLVAVDHTTNKKIFACRYNFSIEWMKDILIIVPCRLPILARQQKLLWATSRIVLITFEMHINNKLPSKIMLWPDKLLLLLQKKYLNAHTRQANGRTRWNFYEKKYRYLKKKKKKKKRNSEPQTAKQENHKTRKTRQWGWTLQYRTGNNKTRYQHHDRNESNNKSNNQSSLSSKSLRQKSKLNTYFMHLHFLCLEYNVIYPKFAKHILFNTYILYYFQPTLLTLCNHFHSQMSSVLTHLLTTVLLYC